MWTWQLALLTLVASLAPLAASAPKSAVAGAPNIPLYIGTPSLGAQFNHKFTTFDPYNQLYNQQVYTYDAVQNNNVLYDNGYNGYYNGGGSYYHPAAYNYNRYGDQTNSYAAKSQRTLKADPIDNGKYHPKKYITGQYDAKLYNSGKNNARNYDSGHYDHAKYGTRPVHGAKLTQAPGSGDFRVKSEGAESRVVGGRPGSVGFAIHADGNGGFNRRQYGQFGHIGTDTNIVGKKSSFVQNNPSFHSKKSSNIKKSSVHKAKESVKDFVGKDFRFNTKDVFAKIDVFGPNHQQLFTEGKRVFKNGQVQGPSPTEQNNRVILPSSTKHLGSADVKKVSPVFNNGRVQGPSPIELSNISPADVINESESDLDSYGFYSELSNLYSDKSFDAKSPVDKHLNQRKTANSLNLNDKQSTAPAFEPAFPAGLGGVVDGIDIIFAGQASLPAAENSDDSYGYYSDLSNLYGNKPWKQVDSAAKLDTTPVFKDFDAGQSQNQLDFDNQRALAPGQLSQEVIPIDAKFDSYGYYSDLGNLYRPEKQKEFPVGTKSGKKGKKVAAGLDRSTTTDNFDAGFSTTGLDFNGQRTRAGDKFDQKALSNDAGFDSYGFYSDLDNLYSADASKGIPDDSVARRQSQLKAVPTTRRVGSKVRVDPVRQVKTTQLRDRPSQEGGLGSLGRRELDTTRSQNEVDFDSYGFYSDPRNLYA